MNNQSIVICGFPGIGKTTFCKKHSSLARDSDSSSFSWITVNGEKIRNPDFPNNYILHIKEMLQQFPMVFVSTHEDVRKMLKSEHIDYIIMIPKIKYKENYISRYLNRGSNPQFIKLLEENWETWINIILNSQEKVFEMNKEYIEDEIINILFKGLYNK